MDRRVSYYIPVMLIAAAALMLQIIEVRILSVLTWYHFAFFAISMGMFGLTVGALLVYLRPQYFSFDQLSNRVASFCWWFAFSIILVLFIQFSLILIAPTTLTGMLIWLVLSITLALPFVCVGVVLSMMLTRSQLPVGRVYAADMIGAAIGCLLSVCLMNHTDAPSALIWVAALAGLAGILFSRVNNSYKQVGILKLQIPLLIVLVLFAVLNGVYKNSLQPVFSKGNIEQPNQFSAIQWNAFSRANKTYLSVMRPFLWGPSPIMPHNIWVKQQMLNIDGDAATALIRPLSHLSQASYLKYDVTNMVYFLHDRPSVAVIGLGGGRDVLAAALFGHHPIDGVDINPIFVHWVQPRLKQFKFVHLYANEGRSWMARQSKQFNIIQMSLIDTWASTGAGAFTLSENGLYTVQAWQTFMHHLKPNGVLSVSRWFNPYSTVEAGRLVSLGVGTLLSMGVQNPQQHIFLFAQGQICTLLLSKSPFDAAAIARLVSTAKHYQHHILISPDQPIEGSMFRKVMQAKTVMQLKLFEKNIPVDITPPTDDKPFFFNLLPFNKMAYLFKSSTVNEDAKGGVVYGNRQALQTLMFLFVMSVILVLVGIIWPAKKSISTMPKALLWSGSGYFFFIGMGFMLIEIALLQRMGIFLGHPIYALSVLLFVLILATGIGSLLSEKLILKKWYQFVIWVVLTVFAICLLIHMQGGLMSRYESRNLWVRAWVCILTVGPIGVLLGFGFPSGMRCINNINSVPTPWFWSINGAAGVLASEIAIAISITFGIHVTLLTGACCYLLTIPCVLRLLSIRPTPR